MVAAEDNQDKLFEKYNSEEEIDIKCWLCKQHAETLDHLTFMRHDKVAALLYYSVCKALDIDTTSGKDTPSLYVNMKMSQCYGIKRQTQIRSYCKEARYNN